MTNTDAARFLTRLFGAPRTAAPVFVTSLANDRSAGDRIPPRALHTRDLDRIAAFCTKWDQAERALYFCVATVVPGKPRAKQNLAELACLHADLDFKSIAATRAEIEQALAQLPLPPSWVNFTGHGLHCFWLFPTALPATPETIERVEAALRRLADVVAGDPAVCEVARLMRLPGSHNSKAGAWIDVATVSERANDYTLEELEAWLATASPVLRRLKTNGHDPEDPWAALAAAQSVKAPIDVEQRLAAMRYRGPGEIAIHITQLSVTAALLGRGTSVEEVIARVLAATRAAAGPVGNGWDWTAEERDLRAMCASWLAKHPEIAVYQEGEPAPEGEGDAESEAAATSVVITGRPVDHGQGVTLADFHAYLPDHNYIFAPTGTFWSAAGVNGCCGLIPVLGRDGKPAINKKGEPRTVAATVWLDRHKAVHHLTWAPGYPMLIHNRLVADGGWIRKRKATTFNLYRPPTLEPGEAAEAGPWLAHVRKIYPDDADHIILWLAHRLQHPEIKINHALVLGGMQGIGKDTLIEPVKRAVGPWNCREVSPQQLMGRFNGFVKSVILRVSEARDLGDSNRYQFYDHTKTYIAAPPDVLRVDEKNLPEHDIFNCVGVIITTNYKTDGIYLPADDRRHYVAWSELGQEDFAADYWNSTWHWYDDGGDRHVAAYLAALDVSGFDPKAPPPKTPAFWDIVGANRPPEEDELADVLEELGNPDAVTLAEIKGKATGGFMYWILDRKNLRAIPHRMEACGYAPFRNPDEKDGRWVFKEGGRGVIYTKKALSFRDRLEAVGKWIGGRGPWPNPPGTRGPA